jgi:hypothetical protein
MLKDACRRKFDVVMAWAIDRLGRSLVDLLGTIQGLEACGVDLYLDQQNIDTTTSVGSNQAHRPLRHEARRGSKAPRASECRPSQAAQQAELAKGIGINKVAKMVGLGVGTVAKLKHEMVAPE